MRYLLSLLALIAPSLAHAQTVQDGFVRPPGVPAYVEKFDGYAAGVVENPIGDGSTARGGVMPVLATMPADIPTTAPGWVVTTTDQTGVSGIYEVVTTPASQEAKFRTVADYSHVAFDDPVRNWGAPGTSHCHMFFGNRTTNAFSSYASLRTRANQYSNATPKKVAATIAGGPENATGYWHPCVLKDNAFGDGKRYAVKASDYVVYYVQNPATPALSAQRTPRGLSYVFGTNMDDPYDTIVKARIATANAQAGTAGRYAYNGSGFLGWSCRSADKSTVINSTIGGFTTFYPGFKTAAGADPWGGACTAGMWMVAEINGPACYDGTNVWSPGGYKHFVRGITDTVGVSGAKGCPKNWFRLVDVSITFWFKHQGFADYGTWYLSSDSQATTKAQQIDAGALAMRAGESFHTDWMGAWNDATFMKWHDNCFGVSGGTMHTCGNSQISATERLAGGVGDAAPDATRIPQVESSDAFTTLVATDMVQVPTSVAGTFTIQAGN